MMFDVEKFWMELLSREPERIRAAYLALPDDDEREAVYDHLLSMVMEEGFVDTQRLSAEIALQALQKLRSTNQL